jgi:hypothetical protein
LIKINKYLYYKLDKTNEQIKTYQLQLNTKFIDLKIKLNQFDEKFNKLFESHQNNSKSNQIIQNQNHINNQKFESLIELIHDQTQKNQNNIKLNNIRIDNILNNQDQKNSENFNKLFDLNKINSKSNNERFDKLFKIIENQSLLQLYMFKSISKLENKFDFYWRKDILASNIPINELLKQGFKTVYDQLYSHVTTNQELYDIKSKCNDESMICVGGSDGLNTLLLVSCGSCFDILTTTELNKPRLVNGAWWYFTPGISFGFASNSSIKQSYADVFDCEGGYIICNDSKRLSWLLQGSGGWRLDILNNNAKTIPSTYRKIILML